MEDKQGNRIKRLVTKAESARILTVVVILVVFFSLSSDVFLTQANILDNVLRPASIVAIIAIGMTFVITSGGLDLSVGATSALASTIGTLVLIRFGIPLWAAVLLTLAIGALVGLFNALIITRIGVAPFIVTLGTLSIGRGLTLVMTGTSFTYGLPDSYRDLGRGYLLSIPTPVVICLLLWLFSVYLFTYTKWGRYARSIGSNEYASRLAGVPVDRYKTYFYVFVGTLAALAGLLWSARANTISVATGTGAELDAIAAVIIGGTNLFGGTGTVTGSVLGAIMLVILGNGLQLMGINTLVQRVVVGFVIIIALAWGSLREEQAAKKRSQRIEAKHNA